MLHSFLLQVAQRQKQLDLFLNGYLYLIYMKIRKVSECVLAFKLRFKGTKLI